MRPGDLAVFGEEKTHILCKNGPTLGPGNEMITESVGLSDTTLFLVIAVIGDGLQEQCLLLGPNVLGWTWGNRLETR